VVEIIGGEREVRTKGRKEREERKERGG
jgi:hypothetical protein